MAGRDIGGTARLGGPISWTKRRDSLGKLQYKTDTPRLRVEKKWGSGVRTEGRCLSVMSLTGQI